MRRTICVLVLIVTALAGSLRLAAADDGQCVACAIENQQRSINQRVLSGKLTRKEGDIAQDNLEWIRFRYIRMKQDGQFAPREVEIIHNMLDQNAEMIFKGLRKVENLYVSPFQQRIDSQQRSIDQGIDSGQLDRKEAKDLQKRLEQIRAEFERMKRDGVLTAREIDRLDTVLDRNDQLIRRDRHDSDTAFNERSRNVEIRIGEQQRHINEGIDSGRLSRREANVLKDNLDWIRMKYTRMKQDGLLTARELDVLHGMLDKNDEMIARRGGVFESVYIGPFQQRIEEQQQLINEHVSSGRLDRREARIVQSNLDRIRTDFNRFLNDRTLSAPEADKLDGMLDRNESMIHKKAQAEPVEQFLGKTLDKILKGF